MWLIAMVPSQGLCSHPWPSSFLPVVRSTHSLNQPLQPPFAHSTPAASRSGQRWFTRAHLTHTHFTHTPQFGCGLGLITSPVKMTEKKRKRSLTRERGLFLKSLLSHSQSRRLRSSFHTSMVFISSRFILHTDSPSLFLLCNFSAVAIETFRKSHSH